MKANGYTAAGCVVLLVAAAVAFKHAQPARPSLVIPAPVVFMLPVVADDVRVIPDVATLATLTVCHSSGGLTDWHPDPVCTPGAVASRVDPSNVRATICRTGGGYPASVRPPTSVTGPVKARLLRVYRMAGGDRARPSDPARVGWGEQHPQPRT